jgi:hypothetical protein
LRKEAGLFVFQTEMAARAGIEPGQPIWPSLAILYLADSYGGQEMAEKTKRSASTGELFTSYAPPS